MTRSDLYSLLGQAVQFYPEHADGAHKQLQTFAVVRSLADLNAQALGKSMVDRFKPFFYSRQWAARGYTEKVDYDLPIAVIIDRSANFRQPFHNQDRKICPLFQLAVLYPNVEQLESSIAARWKDMPVEEIYGLTESMTIYLLEYLSGAVYATTDVNATATWYHVNYLDWLVSESDIASYEVSWPDTDYFRKSLKAENTSNPINYHDDISVHKLCGTSMEFRVCSSECGSGISPTFADAADCCGKAIVQ